jgi:hypothetical protein
MNVIANVILVAVPPGSKYENATTMRAHQWLHLVLCFS